MATQLNSAYVAGLIDGEGTLAIRCRITPRREYYPRATLEIRDEPVVRGLQATYGGCVRKKVRSDKWSDTWCWELTGCDRLSRLLSEISPYLIVKNKQAELIQELVNLKSKNGRGRPVSNEEWVERESLYEAIKICNLRGRNEQD